MKTLSQEKIDAICEKVNSKLKTMTSFSYDDIADVCVEFTAKHLGEKATPHNVFNMSLLVFQQCSRNSKVKEVAV